MFNLTVLDVVSVESRILHDCLHINAKEISSYFEYFSKCMCVQAKVRADMRFKDPKVKLLTATQYPI